MIFNKDGTGGAIELKGLLGFIYKSNRFENLISYVGFAERDIKKIIGKEIFKLAQDHYDSENYLLEEEDEEHPEYTLLDDLVKKIQLPVALNAYRRFAPSGDLTHSDKGRQIFVSDEEKPAFEWQVERDNQNLLSLSFEAIDVLLEFLNEQTEDNLVEAVEADPDAEPPIEAVEAIPNPITNVWMASDAYIKMRSAFITKDEFNDIFPIGGSMRLFITLLPFIMKVQKQLILPVITDTVYQELLEAILDKELEEVKENELEEEQRKLKIVLLENIHPVIVYSTMSQALKSLTVEVLPEGIFQNYISNVVSGKNTAARMDRIEVASRLDVMAKTELKRLQEYIRKLSVEALDETYEALDPLERIVTEDKFVRF
jgi:hypothetical protein